MDIRAILLDFDGTLLQRDQVFISFRNKFAIQKAIEKGVEIIPSTGRVEDMFPPQIEADRRIRYWITSNGARVVDRQTGEILYQSLFTPEESVEICGIFEDQQIYAEIAAEGKIYMEKEVCANLGQYAVPPHHVWFLELGRQIKVDSLSQHFLDNHIGIEKVNLYGVPKAKQKTIIKALEDTGFVSIFEGAGRDIQFFPKRQDRDMAINVLLSKLGIGFEQIMAVGDSSLDVSAISKAAIGVAMGNSPEWVRNMADYVSAPFDENGVAEAIDRFILSKEDVRN